MLHNGMGIRFHPIVWKIWKQAKQFSRATYPSIALFLRMLVMAV
jgi:hypothetical protein